jgi:uncharacterized membrane protein YvlD (DUF360 family)
VFRHPPVMRIAIVLAVDTIALLVLAAILPGFHVDSFWAALGAAAIAGLLNALVWPILSRIALPLNVLTLGISSLLLNGLLVAAAASIAPGVDISDWWTGVGIAIGMAILTSIIGALLAIDDDETWYRNVVRRQARRRGLAVASEIPGVVFIEIDGLAHDVLRRAMRDGSAPTLARWRRDGSHRLERWETDWSSQTGACQAGLLHGDSVDIPAFRWWEKDHGRPIVTNHPRDAAELERRHSDGHGLLYADGASRANIVSGDAPHSMLTMSTAMTRRPPLGRDYAAYFAQPYAAARTFALAIAEVVRERRAASRQRRDDVQPRIERDRIYAVMRAWATVVQLDLQVSAVIGDVLSGRPVIYTTFLAYDEVAHHSGIERPDTLEVLRHVDRQIARIEAAVADAPRPYRLIALADHGQSQGATFLQRYGSTLEDVVSTACHSTDVHSASGGSDEARAFMSTGLTEVARDDTVAGRAVREATERRTAGGAVVLGEEARAEVEATEGDGLPELSVMASGNLGLVTFPREPGRVTLEAIEARWPALLPTLRSHPGIGFVLVRSEELGPVVLGPKGVRRLDGDVVEGEDPLLPFGPNAAAHVRRTDAYPHCPDLVLNSTYWADSDEVAAFEELVGSHGGMGGTQGFPFVLFPAELPFPAGGVIGPDRMHRVFRGWLAGLGQDAYADEPRQPERVAGPV